MMTTRFIFTEVMRGRSPRRPSTQSSWLLVLLLSVVGAVTSFAQLTVGVPVNDPFAGRLAFTGFTNQVTGSNVGATIEANEPAHAGSAPGATVWLSWTAPASGEVTMDTRGSTFDTVLAIYTGNALTALVPVADNDDEFGLITSRVSFPAIAGTTYQIALGGYQGASGNVTFNLSLSAPPVITTEPASQVVQASANLNATFSVVAVGAPVLVYQWQKGGVTLLGATNASLTLTNVVAADAGDYRVVITNAFGSVTSAVATLTAGASVGNDAFANRITLTGENITTGGENLTATLEPGEPLHAGVTNGASVWWTWTAARNGLVTVDTVGSSRYGSQIMDTVLAVYTGNSVEALTGVAANDDEVFGSGLRTSRLVFRAAAGTTYQIAVASYVEPPPEGAQKGNIVLRLVQAADNDFFLNRLTFPPTAVQVLDNNVGATKEPGERDHASLTGSNSVWWSWVAPATGRYQVDTEGSTFDTLLAVYTGSDLGTLTLVEENDGDPRDNYKISRLQFQATAGTAYSIAVDGYLGETGDIALRIYPAPPGAANDAFTNRSALFGLSATDSVSTESASREAGEPVHAGYQGGKSVWWSWKAPASGLCQLDTVGSSFDTLLAVYTGTSLDALTLIAENDGDDSDGFIISRLQFQAVKDTIYQIAVDGYLGAAGDAVINLSLQAAGGNDNFSNRILLTGATNSATGVNTNASKEVGEPNHHGNIGGKSIWWKWVAPATALVTINTRGSDFDAVLGVYTGTTVAALTTIASDHHGADDASTVTFEAVAGTEYQIAVDGFRAGTNQAQGSVVLDLRQYPPGSQIANDNFEDATPLSTLSPLAIGSNLGATRQVNEPAHAGLRETLGHSVWWSWTALTNGPVTISTTGSELDTVLGVYTGASLTALNLVAENDDPGVNRFHAQVTFQATGGTVYFIAVDGYRNAMGQVRLNVSPGINEAAPPVIQQQPASQTRFTGGAGGGTNVEFRVVATGSLPLSYQWLRNGTNLDGATNQVLTLTNVSAGDVGTYQVAVTNSFGSTNSPAVEFAFVAATFNDQFANRIAITGTSVTTSGSVLAATKEPGEPSHGGNDGGRSVWWKWIAPVSGPAEIYTLGSSFDTTMAVYTGSAANALALVGENDDLLTGQVGASRVVFNAVKDTEYQIAVDGFKTNSTSGNVVLSVRQPPEPPLLLGDVPATADVLRGGVLTLQPVFGGIPPLLNCQWYLNGQPISGANSLTLAINSASRTNIGGYQLVATNNFGSVTSRTAAVWIKAPQKISRILRRPDGRSELHFADHLTGELAPATGHFEVQATLNPTGSPLDWSPAAGAISNSGTELIFLDAVSSGSARRFYRIIER